MLGDDVASRCEGEEKTKRARRTEGKRETRKEKKIRPGQGTLSHTDRCLVEKGQPRKDAGPAALSDQIDQIC